MVLPGGSRHHGPVAAWPQRGSSIGDFSCVLVGARLLLEFQHVLDTRFDIQRVLHGDATAAIRFLVSGDCRRRPGSGLGSLWLVHARNGKCKQATHCNGGTLLRSYRPVRMWVRGLGEWSNARREIRGQGVRLGTPSTGAAIALHPIATDPRIAPET